MDFENNPTHLTLPDSQAALAPYPPTCPVLVSNGGETYLGQVHSVYIDLGSATRDNFYRVRPSALAAGAAAGAVAVAELQSVPESSIKYAPGCAVSTNVSALPPFVAEGGGDTRDATIISCVGGAAGGNDYYLLDVSPGPNDSWTNIQSTVPVDAVRYRVPAVQANGDQAVRVISPHPHTIPADEDGSSLNSSSKAPPVASIAFDNRKRPAEEPAQLDVDDGGSSTLSPMIATDGSMSITSNSHEEVVRRIDIPDTLDLNKVKSALVGPDYKINQRMQTKFQVLISILGLDDILGVPPDGAISIEHFSKLGPISFKAGDKCIMIRGTERKVHDASKVVIHMLVNKCYVGDDKDGLMRELRTIRQVRKKSESPKAANADLPSPTKRIKTGGPAAGFEGAGFSGPAETPPQRGWSPAIEEEEAQAEPINAQSSYYGPSEAGKMSSSRGLLPGDGRSSFASSSSRDIPRHTDKYSDGSARIDVKDDEWPIKLAHLDVNHPSGPMQLLMTQPFKEQGVWSARLASPIDKHMLFDRFVKNRNNVAMEEKLRCTFRIEEGRARDMLSMKVSANDETSLNAALSEIASILYEIFVVRASRIRDPMGLVMEGPYTSGQYWHILVKVPSSVHEREVFSNIIGPGGSTANRLKATYHLMDVHVRGEGIVSKGPSPKLLAGAKYPLYVDVWGEDRTNVEEATTYVIQTLESLTPQKYTGPPKQNGPSGGFTAADPPNQPTRRSSFHQESFRAKPSFDGQNWNIDVVSPLSKNATFDLIVGEGGKRKKDLIAMFNNRCFFCLRGDGMTDKNGRPTDGPLRVFIQSADSALSKEAAEHVARILGVIISRPNPKSNHPADIDHSGRSGGEPPRRDGNRLLMEEPTFDGRDWSVKLVSPLDRDSTFDIIIGPRARKKQDLERQFTNCLFFLRGNGSGSASTGPLGTNIDAPLHVLIKAPDRSAAEAAASHITNILLQESGGKADTGPPNRSSSSRLPAPATAVDTQYGRQEWKTVVHASSGRLGDTSAHFGAVVGPGGANLRDIQRKFGVQVTVLGEGVTSSDADHHPRDPMNARIVGPSRQSVDDAALHIARIWDKVSGIHRNGRDFAGIDRTLREIDYFKSKSKPHISEGLPTTRASRQLLTEPYSDKNEWAMAVNSPSDQESLFATVIGQGSMKKRDILELFPDVFLAICGDGIRDMDGRRTDGPLRVSIRCHKKHIAVAAAVHVANLIAFNQGLNLISGDPVFRGNKWQIKIVSPLSEQLLFDTIVGKGGQTKKSIVEKFGRGVYINLRGEGLKGASYGSSLEDHAPLHIDISHVDNKEMVVGAAAHISRILADETRYQMGLRG